MTVGDLPLSAQLCVAIVTAFLWFASTCFIYGVYLGARDVIAYMRTPRHLRAERFPDLHKYRS
jgi:hypothetical protein